MDNEARPKPQRISDYDAHHNHTHSPPSQRTVQAHRPAN